MSELNIIVPALVALVVSIATIFANHFVSDRRARYEAAFELVRYKEGVAGDLRDSVAEFVATAQVISADVGDTESIAIKLSQVKAKILLLVPERYFEYEAIYNLLNLISSDAWSSDTKQIGARNKQLVDMAKSVLAKERLASQHLLANGVERK